MVYKGETLPIQSEILIDTLVEKLLYIQFCET